MAVEILRKSHWAGNTRELKETMVYIMENISFKKSSIGIEDLPPTIRGLTGNSVNTPLSSRFTAMELDILKFELQRQEGSIIKTAKALGMTPRQVSWRLQKHGIDPKRLKKQARLQSTTEQ